MGEIADIMEITKNAVIGRFNRLLKRKIAKAMIAKDAIDTRMSLKSHSPKRNGRKPAPWTDWERERLLKLIRQGKTFSQCGRLMHRSTASCGENLRKMANRGYKDAKELHEDYLKRHRQRAAVKSSVNHPRKRFASKERRKPTRIEIPFMDKENKGALLLEIADLKATHCRWPIDTDDGTRYCGHHAPIGTPYCDKHREIAFTKARQENA
jgi:hypothetical protein